MNNFELMEKQINSYISANTSDYALLITGAWGCGKTFYIERLLENLKLSKKVSYCSLNGATSISNIINYVSIDLVTPDSKKESLINGKDFFSSLYGTFKDNSDNVNLFLNAGSFLTSYFADFHIKQQLKENENKIVIIFDDLERISDKIDITDLLGTIHNKFTLSGAKVIYIADDTQIKEKEKFEKEKEKYILRTIAFANDKDVVFQSFLQKANIFTEDFMDVLHQVFNESQVNLRTVKFCIDCYVDLYNYYKTLSENDYNSPSSLFYSICQLGKFYRQGNSNKEELQELMSTYFHISYLNKKENEMTSYDRFALEYYSKIERQSFLLDLIYDGVFSEEEVKFYLRKPENYSDPLYSLTNIYNMETSELVQKLKEIGDNLRKKNYSYKQYGLLRDSYIPNVLKLNLDTEKHLYKLLAESVFAENNIKELADTFGYWQIDSFARMDKTDNAFEKQLLIKYEDYCKKEKEKRVGSFYQSLKICDRVIFKNTSQYHSIYSDLISLGYLKKIFELPNKSIRHFSYFIDVAICHLIEAYRCYESELSALNCFIKMCKAKLRNIDKNDILKIEAIQYLNSTIETAIKHIESRE